MTNKTASPAILTAHRIVDRSGTATTYLDYEHAGRRVSITDRATIASIYRDADDYTATTINRLVASMPGRASDTLLYRFGAHGLNDVQRIVEVQLPGAVGQTRIEGAAGVMWAQTFSGPVTLKPNATIDAEALAERMMDDDAREIHTFYAVGYRGARKLIDLREVPERRRADKLASVISGIEPHEYAIVSNLPHPDHGVPLFMAQRRRRTWLVGETVDGLDGLGASDEHGYGGRIPIIDRNVLYSAHGITLDGVHREIMSLGERYIIVGNVMYVTEVIDLDAAHGPCVVWRHDDDDMTVEDVQQMVWNEQMTDAWHQCSRTFYSTADLQVS